MRVSREERAELAKRAAAAKVSVARYLTESALAPALSAPERRGRERELLEVSCLIGQLSADVNELARVARLTGRPPEGTAEAQADGGPARRRGGGSPAPRATRSRPAVIVKITRGTSVGGLVRYLFGPGRANEHYAQHVVAGGGVDRTPVGGQLNAAQVRELSRQLDGLRAQFNLPTRAAARTPTAVPVAAGTGDRAAPETTGRPKGEPIGWHCSLTNPASDRVLSDEEWARIARGAMDAMGFTEAAGKAPVRWVAIRHGLGNGGNDHLHIAVSLVRTDGTRPSVFRDYKTMSAYAASVERDYGLSIVGGRSHRRTTRAHRAELERAGGGGRTGTDPAGPDRARGGRRHRDEAEFVRRLAGRASRSAPAARTAGGRPSSATRWAVEDTAPRCPLRRAGHWRRISPSPSSASTGRRPTTTAARCAAGPGPGGPGRPGDGSGAGAASRAGGRPGPRRRAYEALPESRPRTTLNGPRSPGRRPGSTPPGPGGSRATGRARWPGPPTPWPLGPGRSRGTGRPVRSPARGYRGAAMVVTQGSIRFEDRGMGWAMFLGQLNRNLRLLAKVHEARGEPARPSSSGRSTST